MFIYIFIHTYTYIYISLLEGVHASQGDWSCRCHHDQLGHWMARGPFFVFLSFLCLCVSLFSASVSLFSLPLCLSAAHVSASVSLFLSFLYLCVSLPLTLLFLLTRPTVLIIFPHLYIYVCVCVYLSIAPLASAPFSSTYSSLGSHSHNRHDGSPCCLYMGDCPPTTRCEDSSHYH